MSLLSKVKNVTIPFWDGRLGKVLLFLATGRLSEEITYTEKITGRKGFQNEAEFGYEVLMQSAKDENQNMLTSAALKDHLEMVKKVKDIKSRTFGV